MVLFELKLRKLLLELPGVGNFHMLPLGLLLGTRTTFVGKYVDFLSGRKGEALRIFPAYRDPLPMQQPTGFDPVPRTPRTDS